MTFTRLFPMAFIPLTSNLLTAMFPLNYKFLRLSCIEKVGGTDGRTDRHTDRRTNRRTWCNAQYGPL